MSASSQRVRLSRDGSAAAMAGCATMLGVLLIAIGAFPIYMTMKHDGPGEHALYFIVGGGFALVGLLLLYSGVMQQFARATPETIVTADVPFVRGRRASVTIEQPGPVSLISLRVNLVGEEKWATSRSGRSATSGMTRRDTSWHTKHLGTFNVLSVNDVDVGPEPLVAHGELDVPQDLEPSRERHGDDRRSVEWRLEVWGKVRGRADFMHPFVVIVR
jgi:hypothetical protein